MSLEKAIAGIRDVNAEIATREEELEKLAKDLIAAYDKHKTELQHLYKKREALQGDLDKEVGLAIGPRHINSTFHELARFIGASKFK